MSDEDTGHWAYAYNSANQLVSWTKRSEPGNATVQKSATLTYDDAGNRTSQSVTETVQPSVPTGTHPGAAQPGLTQYAWDAQDRLSSVTMPDGSEHRYEYDYRTRRIRTQDVNGTTAKHTAIVFSGGLSVAEWESTTNQAPGTTNPPTVEYTRGPDMGGGVGGLLYTSRSESASASRTLRYNLSNGRGDIVAQSDSYASLTWTASYEAYGKRTKETGENKDKQRGNSKDEDPTGLLNEGFRYRDIETGVWLSRDPAGFVDGPNLYAYVKQNPWTAWDPDGLFMLFQVPFSGMIRPLVQFGETSGRMGGEGVMPRMASMPRVTQAEPLPSPAQPVPTPAAQPAPVTNFRPAIDTAIMPVPDLSRAPTSPTTSSKDTKDRNHKILFIQNNYDEGTQQSNELHEFVGRWNEEIVKRGGSMTTRTPTVFDNAAKRVAQDRERAKNPGAYAGKAVGHIPDVIAGGDPKGPFMPLDSQLNSSIGRQVQIYHQRSKSSTLGFGGFQYNEVKVVPKPPPPNRRMVTVDRNTTA